MWQIFFVLPCVFIFFLLSLNTGTFDEMILVQSVYVLIISFLLLPLYYDHLPRKWNVGRKVRTHIVFSLSMFMLLHAGYLFRLGITRNHSYDYRFGHTSGPFRLIYSAKPFQFVIGGMYRISPVNYQIGFYQKEDVTRVARLESDVDSDFTRSLLCSDKDRATCFLSIVKSSVSFAPTGTAGTLLIYEKGASFLREEEVLWPDKHENHVMQSREFLNIITALSMNTDTELFVPEGRPDLLKMQKSEKKMRFYLAHLDPIVSNKRNRRIAGN